MRLCIGPPPARLQTWERCLGCGHWVGAHEHPEGACHARRCECEAFAWADEGPRVGSFRLCLRWLWRLEMGNGAGAPTADRVAALGALQALTRSLGPAHAGQILTEEGRRWEARTGWAPRTRTFENARTPPI